MLAGKTIVVCITGGVAAHYIPELIGQLRYRHLATVHAVMTPAATRFVSKLTVATATGAPIWTDTFEDAERDPLAHIHLARLTDLILVAPATFDFIGKVSAGRANDSVSLFLAATIAPVVLAPAMHDTMWANHILQRNLAQLQAAKYRVIPPVMGLQADGEMGTGRMASIPVIIKTLLNLVQEHPNKTED